MKPEVTSGKAVVRSVEKLNWMHRLSCPTIYHGIVFIEPVTSQADVGANNHSVGMNDHAVGAQGQDPLQTHAP
ncbi:hypothetical protein [Nostoc sp.]